MNKIPLKRDLLLAFLCKNLTYHSNTSEQLNRQRLLLTLPPLLDHVVWKRDDTDNLYSFLQHWLCHDFPLFCGLPFKSGYFPVSPTVLHIFCQFLVPPLAHLLGYVFLLLTILKLQTRTVWREMRESHL